MKPWLRAQNLGAEGQYGSHPGAQNGGQGGDSGHCQSKRKGRPVNQTNSPERPKPVPTRFHNNERHRQFSFRISAENSFQFLMCCRQSLGRNSEVKHAFAQTLDEYEPAKILIACDEQPLLVRCPPQQAPVRRTRKIQFGGSDGIVTKIAKQAASYRVNVLVEQKSHKGTPI